MENGYLILGIIALLFISMYGFSYFSVYREKMTQIKEEKNELQRQEMRRQQRIKNQELIDERVRSFNKRKEEIQHELMLLEKVKQRQKVG